MQQKTSLTGLLLWQLAGFTVLITFVVIALWVLGYTIASAILGTATGALYLLLIVLATSHITRRNTIETMQAGAEIALRAEQINDSSDAKKTQAMATLFREAARLGASNAPRLSGGAPPFDLPPVENWLQLPQDTDFIEGELGD